MKRYPTIIIFSIFLFGSCENGGEKVSGVKEDSNKGEINVIATNYPLFFFANAICGGDITISTLFPTESDPAFWNPNEEEVTALQSADLVLTNGAGYEKWIGNISLSPQKLINTTGGLESNLIREETNSKHSHGNEGEHVHGGYAITTWINPQIAVYQLNQVYAALTNLNGEVNESWLDRKTQLEASLKLLDRKTAEMFYPEADYLVAASHPLYQYFGQRYSLEIISEHWEPGQMISDVQWNEFEDRYPKKNPKFMLWEGEPHEELRKLLEEKGIQIVIFNPCGNEPSEGDYLSEMDKNISSIKKCLSTN